MESKSRVIIVGFTEYFILLFLHQELEKQVKNGKVKSLGFSNFNKTQLLKIWENSEIKPTDLQVSKYCFKNKHICQVQIPD